jgi:hypothetical protein
VEEAVRLAEEASLAAVEAISAAGGSIFALAATVVDTEFAPYYR